MKGLVPGMLTIGNNVTFTVLQGVGDVEKDLILQHLGINTGSKNWVKK